MKLPYQILLPDWIITVNSDFEILSDYALVIKGNRIEALVSRDELDEFPEYQQTTPIELPDCVLMPGLINAHTHASMTLLRGLADDMPLMQWLGEHIWPAESQWVDSEFCLDGFELAAAEMIRSGTTCFNDMYFFPDDIARRAQEIGIRCCVGLIVLDFPTVWAKDADEYLHKALALHDEIRELPLVTSALAPHAPYTVSDDPLKKIAMYSNELDIPVHMHIHETAFEVSEAQQKNGMRPLERLDQLNLLNPNLIAVHMTELNEFEMNRVGEAGVNIAHCPESNLKLASGHFPLAEMLSRDINISLGTDGAASNNDLDMFGEMRTAALLGKGIRGDAASCSAQDIIRMATINGARALGLANQIGSLEAGKRADLIAVNLNTPNTQPVYDPAAQIVYAANSRQVSHVWIDGKLQLNDFELCHLNAGDLIRKAQVWAQKVKN
ncbi:MAG: TRZ/ATZ family hydrolase [Pseudomonadota bacterium]